MTDAREVLDRMLSSSIKADLLILFHKNPGLVDVADGVARRIGRTAETIEADLKDLVDLGVLRMEQVGKLEVFLLDHARDKEMQSVIADHIRSLSPSKGV
jgi:predicted transcriptional regulator